MVFGILRPRILILRKSVVLCIPNCFAVDVDDYVYSATMDKIIIDHLDYLGEDLSVIDL